MSAPAEVGQLTHEYAQLLSMSKQQFLEPRDSPGRLLQVGGAYIGTEIELPAIAEPPNACAIETFVIDQAGSCEPTGANEALIDTFETTATSVADLMLDALLSHNVAAIFPGYLTVAITPLSEVSCIPHFDDEQYQPSDGVGVVAVLPTSSGTRIARDDLPIGPVRAGLPLDFPDSVVDGFWSEDVGKQVADAGRLLVMPQFGQLHAGPRLAAQDAEGYRTTIVIRFGTNPVTEKLR